MTEPVVIAGGGIGGLAAALGLARAGCRVLVLEQAAQFGEIGAGIQIGPNAFHAFDYLGVGDRARQVAVYIDALQMMDATDGSVLAHIPVTDRFRQRFGNPYAVVHRADLHGVLYDACRESELIQLRTSTRVTGYENTQNGVQVLTAAGPPIAARALIGADGLHSAIRRQMLDDDPPRVSGHTTYRTVIPTEKMPADLRWNMMNIWVGPKCHIVHYPLKGGKVFNLVVTFHRDVTEAVSGVPVTHDEVRAGFDHIVPQARQIIDHGENWKMWVLCDRDPVLDWVDGRVALLGDAAHPMLQYLAQGACMALEDGVNLAHQVRQHPGDIAAALLAYNRQRTARTGRVQLSSRAMGDMVYHPEGAAAHVRNEIMRSRDLDEWLDRMEWLYGSNGIESGN